MYLLTVLLKMHSIILLLWKKCSHVVVCYLKAFLITKLVTPLSKFPSPLSYPLTSCCGPVRGQIDRHMHTKVKQTYSDTVLRGTMQPWVLNHTTIDISICVIRFLHIQHQNTFAYVICGLVFILLTLNLFNLHHLYQRSLVTDCIVDTLVVCL